MKTFCFFNRKGGSGKTTLLILLACYMILNKKAVGDLGLKNLNVGISIGRILTHLNHF